MRGIKITKFSDMGSGNETFHVGAGVNKDHLKRLHSRVDQQSTLIEMLK